MTPMMHSAEIGFDHATVQWRRISADTLEGGKRTGKIASGYILPHSIMEQDFIKRDTPSAMDSKAIE